MNGTCFRQAGFEAPEQIGRGERHGGITMSAMKAVIKDRPVIGKEHMKQFAIIVQQGKNDNLTNGGFATSQWVLGKYPRRPGRFSEEDWGQLGALAARLDSSTATLSHEVDCAEGVCSTRLRTTLCSCDVAEAETN